MVSGPNNMVSMPVSHNAVPQEVSTQNALTQNAILAQDNVLTQNATLAQDVW